jgi:ABC-type multidrug transport system ATPase subunit
VAFKDISAYGYGSALDCQSTVGNTPLQLFGAIKTLFGAQQDRIDILRNVDGLVRSGEMLVVLGPPGR